MENESKLSGIECTRGQLPTNKAVRIRVYLKVADGNKNKGIYSLLFLLNIGRYTIVILVQTSRKYLDLGIVTLIYFFQNLQFLVRYSDMILVQNIRKYLISEYHYIVRFFFYSKNHKISFDILS